MQREFQKYTIAIGRVERLESTVAHVTRLRERAADHAALSMTTARRKYDALWLHYDELRDALRDELQAARMAIEEQTMNVENTDFGVAWPDYALKDSGDFVLGFGDTPEEAFKEAIDWAENHDVDTYGIRVLPLTKTASEEADMNDEMVAHGDVIMTRDEYDAALEA